MAKFPKVIYKKISPSELQRVDRDRYYIRIHEGWGVVSAAKVARRTNLLLERMEMSFEQFWERVLRTFRDPLRAKAWYKKAIEGKIEDSQVDFVLLHVLATATCQPVSYFTQEQNRVPVWPWKYWALDQAAERARKLRHFQVHYRIGEHEGERTIQASDEIQVRSLWKEKFPESEIIAVRIAPVGMGVVLR